MKNIFRREASAAGHPKHDAGSGSFDDYKYDLLPANKNVTIQLAGSDPFQDEIARVQAYGQATVDTFIGKRTAEEERTDAPIAVRFFVDSRMSGQVGTVPRGLEAVVVEALSRLETAGRSTRIPARIVKTRHGLRVTLLMGATR